MFVNIVPLSGLFSADGTTERYLKSGLRINPGRYPIYKIQDCGLVGLFVG